MNDRWGISIDIEGFSANYEYSEERKTYAILALSELMNAVHRIGTRCFPGVAENNYSERLFAHQFGDGFIICSDFPEQDASRAIAIAISIMRHLIIKGYAAKAAISTGDFSDIKGCYPDPMRDADEDRLDMGMGLMTIISVMGTALTKAHKLGASAKGAVLVVDKGLLSKGLAAGVKLRGPLETCVDWVFSVLPLADEIARKSELLTASSVDLCAKLKAYCETNPAPSAAWIDATYAGVNCRGA